MLSKITGGETQFLFTKKVLNKYDVNYYKCVQTGFIQTDEPFWLDEAYSTAITKLDIGLIKRNIEFSAFTGKLIAKHFNANGTFIDYAGGYGMFTRLMRDKGFDFYNTDKFCENIFAQNFDLSDSKTRKFEILTAFEVFEHLNNPYVEIEEMLANSPNILFSTEIIPKENIADWWYLIPETGQHIALYTLESLEYIAKKYSKNFYSNGSSLHMFTDKKFNKNPLSKNREPFFIRKIRKFLKVVDQKNLGARESFLEKDWSDAKSKLNIGVQ